MAEQVMPHDRETELNVLGTILRYNERWADVSDMLVPAAFYDIQLEAVFRCAVGVIEGGGITDVNSVAAYAAEHHIRDVERHQIAQVLPCCSELTFMQDVARLLHMMRQRSLWTMFTGARDRILSPSADIEAETSAVIESLRTLSTDPQDGGIASFGDALAELRGIAAANMEGRHEYLRTGFRLIDGHYVLRPRTLTILAAFTSVGKSALAMNISVAVAQTGIPVAYYSGEMGKSELAARCVSYGSHLPPARILNTALRDLEMQRLDSTMETMRELPIYIDEEVGRTYQRTLRSIRKMVKRRGVRLAVIDYLQIYTQTGETAEASLAQMAREAKNIAVELDIAVLVLSQLNRSDRHPNIRMLRGSGQIEESADNVLLIDRPAAYPDSGMRYEGDFATESVVGTAKLILAKGRGVGTGTALVGFDGEHVRFYEINRQQKQLPFEPSDEEVDWENM